MSSGASIQVRGLDEILARFARGGQIVTDELDDTADSVLAYGIQKLKRYPPPRGTYQRTGALGRGWTETERTIRVGRGIAAVLSNPVSYAGLVQGERQAWMHKGRWTSVVDVQAELEGYGQAALENAAQRIARALEG